MIGQVVVLEPAQYQAWLAEVARRDRWLRPAQNVFPQLGCSTCHRVDTQGRGPNLVGLFGKQVQLEDGRVGRRPTKITFANRILAPRRENRRADSSPSCRCFRDW